MFQQLGKIMLAGPLTMYYGYTTDNRLVRYGMYALGAGIIAEAVLSLYKGSQIKTTPTALGNIRTINIKPTIDSVDRLG